MYCIHFSPDTPGPLCCPFKRREIGSGENTHTCLHTHTEIRQTQCFDQYATWTCQFDSWWKKEGVKELQNMLLWNKSISSSLSQRKTEIHQYCLVQEFSEIEVKMVTLKQSTSSAKDQNHQSHRCNPNCPGVSKIEWRENSLHLWTRNAWSQLFLFQYWFQHQNSGLSANTEYCSKTSALFCLNVESAELITWNFLHKTT